MPTPLDRPRVRPGVAAARDDRDPHAILLFDELRLTRQVVRVSPREFTWLQWLDGQNTLRDVQAAAMRQSGGLLTPIEPLLELVDRLDAALFLDGPRFEAFLTGPVREPSCVGCYPADPDEIRRQLDGYFTAEGGPGLPAGPKPGGRRLRALLAPHIDYARGNVAYAWAYKELAERCDASLFVIVGTAHYSGARYTLSRQDFKTPLGVAPTDQGFVDRLVEHFGDGLFDDPVAHYPEHSIELEVVWLQHLFGRSRPLRIVPLLTGSLHDCVEAGRDPARAPDVARMAEALRRAEAGAGEAVCYVISGDLAHIGPKFGDAGPVGEPILSESRAQDDAILRACAAADPAAYFRVVAAEGDRRRICGLPPTWVTLAAARPSSGRLLHYGRYVHPRGHESVSFASMAFDA